RQAMTVESGQTYDFSVWIRHTKGTVRARLYADGYRGYSDAGLTGRWQKLSYRYRATQSGTIEVGLRFYDGEGFRGSELVYIDSFAPAAMADIPDDPAVSTLGRYYSAAESKRGEALRTALSDIINT